MYKTQINALENVWKISPNILERNYSNFLQFLSEVRKERTASQFVL